MAEIIEFKDGQLVSSGYVEIEGVQHEVHEAEYEGETPISAYNLNRMQANLLTKKHKIQVLNDIAENEVYELPCSYIVGNDSLELYIEGVLLSIGDHYIEVGTRGEVSNQIRFTWDVKADYILTAKVRGEMSTDG